MFGCIPKCHLKISEKIVVRLYLPIQQNKYENVFLGIRISASKITFESYLLITLEASLMLRGIDLYPQKKKLVFSPLYSIIF